jgi:hypothetical protein
MPDTSLGHALAELVDDVEAGDSLRTQIARRERRIRRRPFLTIAAALLTFAVLGVGVFLVDRNEQRSVVTEPRPTTTSTTTTTASSGRHEGFAIWPVVDPNEFDSYRSQRSLPASASEAASSFARQVLGWSNPSAVVREALETEGLYLLDVTADEGDGEVGIRRVSPNEYVVRWVYTFPGSETQADSGGGIGFFDGKAQISFSAPIPLGGTVDILVRKGKDEHRATGLHVAETTFHGVDMDSIGSVLVLYRDSSGAVVDAWGTPVGDGQYFMN